MATGTYERWTAMSDYMWTRDLIENGTILYQGPTLDTEQEIVDWCTSQIALVAAMDPPQARLPRFQIVRYQEVRDENTPTMFSN